MDQAEFLLSDREFARIQARVYEEAGIALSDSKRTLVIARLGKILRRGKFTTFTDYLDHLESEGTALEGQDFVNALTTNLTRFWREDHHFTHLVHHVGEIVQARAGTNVPHRLRIWSAGCSTGQEPYSIALSLIAALPELKRWDFKILATDIDTVVLQKAAAGIYPLGELEGLAPERARLFERTDDGKIKVPSAIAALISFKPLNLLGAWPMKGPFDAIFCRNVAIYFDRTTQNDLFARLGSMLTTNGILYIGHSENLGAQNQNFRLIGKTIYQARNAPKAASAA